MFTLLSSIHLKPEYITIMGASLIIIISFVFIKGAVERLLGIDNSKKHDKSKDKVKEAFSFY